MTKEEKMKEHNEYLQAYINHLEVALVSSWAWSFERLGGVCRKDSRKRAEHKLMRFKNSFEY